MKSLGYFIRDPSYWTGLFAYLENEKFLSLRTSPGSIWVVFEILRSHSGIVRRFNWLIVSRGISVEERNFRQEWFQYRGSLIETGLLESDNGKSDRTLISSNSQPLRYLRGFIIMDYLWDRGDCNWRRYRQEHVEGRSLEAGFGVVRFLSTTSKASTCPGFSWASLLNYTYYLDSKLSGWRRGNRGKLGPPYA